MSAGKMHADEVAIDPSLVRRLLEAQFPRWAHLPIETVRSAGTDNAIYRLGTSMAVRLPRIAWATGQVEKEQQWLPILASHLPIAIPVPLAKGAPGDGYPWHWSICRWLEGHDALTEPIADLGQAARQLAEFIIALQGVDPTDGPPPGPNNSFRGVPLAKRDTRTREAILELRRLDVFDGDTAAAATEVWEAALHATPSSGPPVWIHGDLQGGNLLVQHGRLSAVIDFGCLGVGDPACDLIVAWNFFDAQTREVFRATLQVDDATWARGRGWGLSTAVIALPYYLHTNPAIVRNAWYRINEVLADHRLGA